MSEPFWMAGPPTRILLATDLSARSDRALDRAVQLAQQWQAELVAFNVLEPRDPDQILGWLEGADDAELDVLARRQLARDLAGSNVTLRVRTSRAVDTPAAIAEAASGEDCALVLAGVARSEAVGRFLLGSTVSKLARTLKQPLLVVRERVRGPYRRVLVGTDFSEASRLALQGALRLFPSAELVLYHACEPLLGGLPGRPRTSVASAEAGDECAHFLEGSGLTAEERGRIEVVIEQGSPEQSMARYCREREVDLAVIGNVGRTGLMEALLGGTANRLLDWLPCDTLVMRAKV